MKRRNTKPRPRAIDPRNNNSGQGLEGTTQIRCSIAMLPGHWARLDAAAKPSPWEGNRSAFLRDLVKGYKPALRRLKA